jgi:uncharacterized membrane protein YphA (DoxX/SURF4 family)
MESAYVIPMATLMVRVVLGILFFAQGYDKIFRIGINAVVDAASTDDMHRILGKGLLKASVLLSSWVELLAGALLIVGFQKDVALIALSADMIVAGIIFTLIKPMWDMQFYFPRLAMLVFMAIIPPGWDIWGIDWMLR